MNREKFSRPGYTKYDYLEVSFFREEFAKKVLIRLKDIAKIVGSVSLADFEYCTFGYGPLSRTYISYEMICYGWSEKIINNAEVVLRDDLLYVINLPKPKVIEKLVY